MRFTTHGARAGGILFSSSGTLQCARTKANGAAVTQNGNNNVALVDNKKITINVFGKEEVGHISAERIMAEEIFPDGHSSEGTMSEPSGLEEIS